MVDLMNNKSRLKEIEEYFKKYNNINEVEHAWILGRVKKLTKQITRLKREAK